MEEDLTVICPVTGNLTHFSCLLCHVTGQIDPANTSVYKCNRMMGMIKRSVGYKAPINVTSYLYSTLVRSNLEHCSTVWSPFNFNEMQELESIQRAAIRYMLHYPD